MNFSVKLMAGSMILSGFDRKSKHLIYFPREMLSNWKDFSCMCCHKSFRVFNNEFNGHGLGFMFAKSLHFIGIFNAKHLVFLLFGVEM